MNFIKITFALCVIAVNSFAQLVLPSIFSDNMVLQQGIDVPIWGKTKPNEKITVKFDKQTKTTVADAEGCWKVFLSPLSVDCNPQKMSIESAGSKIVISNILVGEVWVCSGQSNMEFPMGMLKNPEEEIAKAKDSNIRYCVINKYNFKPYECDNCQADWKECSPDVARVQTAAGYYFARELRKKINVPVGLIAAYFGGANIEAWSSANTLRKWKYLQKELAEMGKYTNNKKYNLLKERDLKNWFKKLSEFDKGFTENWMSKNFHDKNWEKISVPNMWANTKNLKNFKGTVWLRKKIKIPAKWKNKNLIFDAGVINGYDINWFNGKLIGMQQWPWLFWMPRHYLINKSDCKIGENEIVVQVYNKDSSGGMQGEQIKIYPEGEPENFISLAGEWRCKKGYSGKDLPKAPIPFLIAHHTPAALYNSMIAPIIPFGIRGVIWYQGESNQQKPYEYREMFPDMINA